MNVLTPSRAADSTRAPNTISDRTWMMVLIVVASGFVGRFVYTAVPKLASAEPGARRALSLWYLLHVPVAAALFVLAAVHVAGAVYYATLLR